MGSNERGFTLLEVLIAIAIMVTALATILAIEGASLNASEKAKQMNIVAMLAKDKMVETELYIEGKTFDEVDKDKDGTFDAPFQDFRWKRTIKELTFPALTSVGDSNSQQPNDAANSQIADMLSKLFSNYLSKALREVTVTIIWKRGKKDQEFSVSTYWVDLNHEFDLTQ